MSKWIFWSYYLDQERSSRYLSKDPLNVGNNRISTIQIQESLLQQFRYSSHVPSFMKKDVIARLHGGFIGFKFLHLYVNHRESRHVEWGESLDGFGRSRASPSVALSTRADSFIVPLRCKKFRASIRDGELPYEKLMRLIRLARSWELRKARVSGNPDWKHVLKAPTRVSRRADKTFARKLSARFVPDPMPKSVENK